MNEEEIKQRKLENKKRRHPLWQLNEQMKKLREDNGISVEEFAEIIHMRIENVEAKENNLQYWKLHSLIWCLRKFDKTMRIEVVDKE